MRRMEDVMAYADMRQRASGPGIGAALAINGLMVAGIILSVPDIVPPEFEHRRLIRIFTIPPKPQPLAQKPRQKQPDKRLESPIQQPDKPPEASTVSQALAGDTLPIGPSGDPGTGSFVHNDPPAIPPLFKPAQFNPNYLGALQPIYPPGMIRAEMEGVVTIRVLIGTDGRVKAVETVKASETAFLEATRKQALGKWRFLPATRDGAPVESWREMTVRFRLPD